MFTHSDFLTLGGVCVGWCIVPAWFAFSLAHCAEVMATACCLLFVDCVKRKMLQHVYSCTSPFSNPPRPPTYPFTCLPIYLPFYMPMYPTVRTLACTHRPSS
jgi:hypothetical protein